MTSLFEFGACINGATMVVSMNSPPADMRADAELTQDACKAAFPGAGK